MKGRKNHINNISAFRLNGEEKQKYKVPKSYLKIIFILVLLLVGVLEFTPFSVSDEGSITCTSHFLRAQASSKL